MILFFTGRIIGIQQATKINRNSYDRPAFKVCVLDFHLICTSTCNILIKY